MLRIILLTVAGLLLTVARASAQPPSARASAGSLRHVVVAKVAKALLPDETSEALARVLGDRSLEDASTWISTVQGSPLYQWTAPLHAQLTPAWACAFVAQRDCADGQCLPAAVRNLTDGLRAVPHFLGDSVLLLGTGVLSEQDAVMLLVNLVADAHFPLSAGFVSDAGGALLPGAFFGASMSLAVLWDAALLARRVAVDFSGSVDLYARALLDSAQGGAWGLRVPSPAPTNCSSGGGALACPLQWANESAAAACATAYVYPNGTHLAPGFAVDSAYYVVAAAAFDRSLATAGVRLAAVLTALYPTEPGGQTDVLLLVLSVVGIVGGGAFFVFLLVRMYRRSAARRRLESRGEVTLAAVVATAADEQPSPPASPRPHQTRGAAVVPA